jgi:hypothetical protein
MLQLDKNGLYILQDKRRSPRRASLNRCVVERCFSKNEKIPSRSVNFSETGFMLGMDYPVKLGDVIKVQFSKDADETQMYGKSVCVGIVRWCKPQDGSCCGLYGVGVELANRFHGTACINNW